MLPQVLVNVRVTDKTATRKNQAVQTAVKNAEAELGESGRVLLRESGTEPLIRVMVEAETEPACRKIANDIAAVIRAEGLARE